MLLAQAGPCILSFKQHQNIAQNIKLRCTRLSFENQLDTKVGYSTGCCKQMRRSNDGTKPSTN